ncbi:MAG: glycosyltransferase family 8 protein [Synergistes sp.]|nr:glycosyltransferase family 8 protein [Synergistes sp.]
MNKETIQIAVAFCDPKGTYSRHAAVTMASIFANTKEKVCVNIVHDETLTAENREKLEETARSFGQDANFICAGSLIDDKSIDVSKLTVDGARGTLYRLLLPDIVESEKIIYLDCDIVVNMDITELWNVPLGDHAAAAVRDVWSLDYIRGVPVPWRLAMVWDILGVRRDEYFNAGVLLLNLKKLRGGYGFLSKVEDFYARYKKCITLADQDCLNYIFADDKILIDERFNRINTDGVGEEDLRGSIWHMAGGASKPWAVCTRPYVDDLYWRYLCLTPYCRDRNDLIRLMLSGLSSPAYTHIHSSQCIKRLKKQMADNIFRAHIWTIPYILAAKLRGRKK